VMNQEGMKVRNQIRQSAADYLAQILAEHSELFHQKVMARKSWQSIIQFVLSLNLKIFFYIFNQTEEANKPKFISDF